VNKLTSRKLWLPVLLTLTVLLPGCATKSTDSTVVQPPQPPTLSPSLAKPVPPESFLERARRDIEEWRQRLTGSETK
jgi:hypothetical protein